MSERIAVVGAGIMGGHHARTLGTIEGASLSYVVDADLARAEAIARQFGDEDTRVATDLSAVDKEVADAAIIASPSQFHEEQAHNLIEKGMHVLIEKPVASTTAEAIWLHKAASSMGVVAMAGHIELFNPTVTSLMSLVEGQNIREMSFDRLGSVPDSSRLYHDVVNDLMIHDMAIAQRLLERSALPIDGVVQAAVGRADTVAAPDPARATVRFGGVDAHFRASRAYPAGKVRQAVIETDDKIYSADLLARSIETISATSPVLLPDSVIAEDTFSTKYFPQDSQQPLTVEQKFFLDCIRGKATPEDRGVSIIQASRLLTLTRGVLDRVRYKVPR